VLGVGTELMSSDRVENGYRNVLHKASGAKGWVWDAYVSDGRNGGDGGSGVRLTTTAAVNHRTSPSTSASIITVIPAGATVYGLGESSNGFEKVRYNNKTGWVYAAYLR
jgi:SH3-like domain-containing protein